MPMERFGRDLHIRVGYLYIKLRLRGVVCVTNCQPTPKHFSLNLFLLPSFVHSFVSWQPFSPLSETLLIRYQ